MSPVTLAQFQTYLHDSSTDPAITAFYQSLIDMATERVYTWLDRDYTASATKTDVFNGDDSSSHVLLNTAGTLLTWVYVDAQGTLTTADVSDLMLRMNGSIVFARSLRFQSGVEHRLTYQQPSTLVCPETVRQVITEIAALEFQLSNQGAGALGLFSVSSRDIANTDRERYLDMTERHRQLLSPYRRWAI